LGQIYTKNYHFWRFFWAVRPHLLSQNGKIWREGANPEDPPHAKFCKKNRLRVFPFLAKLYQKN